MILLDDSVDSFFKLCRVADPIRQRPHPTIQQFTKHHLFTAILFKPKAAVFTKATFACGAGQFKIGGPFRHDAAVAGCCDEVDTGIQRFKSLYFAPWRIVGAHLAAVGAEDDEAFPLYPTDELFRAVAAKPFPTISDAAGERMQRLILSAREAQDSVGGIVECAAIGLPAGLGDPMFDGIENRLASALFGIPAVKGVEFGAGFDASRLRGSENNDAFRVEDGRIVTETNRSGGILGGITTGMPLTLRVGIKPTPSIGRPQKTVSLARMENTELTIRGRHDPCIAHRAVPVVEAVTACVLLDLLLEEHHGTF